jgi:hypothetical protein
MAEEGEFIKLQLVRTALAYYCTEFAKRGRLELIAKDNIGEGFMPINPDLPIKVEYKSPRIEDPVYIQGVPKTEGAFKGYFLTIEGLPPFARMRKDLQERIKSLSAKA